MMMRKSVLVILIASIAIVSGFHSPQRASASVSYSWTYTNTNIYSGFAFSYDFTGLDSATTYRWDLYLVNPATGEPTTSLGFDTFTGGTTHSVVFGTDQASSVTNTINYPNGYVGPLAVVDSNGTILGRHYVAQLPGAWASPDSQWFDWSGNTGVDLKQAVGTGIYFGDCKSPVYAEINSDGWQHTFTPCSVTTLSGGYALLHYQIDPAYTLGTHDKIKFYLIPNSTVALTIDVDDIIAFETDSVWAGQTNIANSFLVINTNGQSLPFVDNGRALGSFVTSDNPELSTFDTGVYNYSRYDSGGTWLSDGESVWIVSDDPTGNEWTLTGLSHTGEGGIQILKANAVTQNVWDSYHGFQQVSDVAAGYSDTTVYSFAAQRRHQYNAVAFTADGVIAQWTNRALAINSGLATSTEMEFIVDFTYDVQSVPPIDQLVNTVIGNAGLDTTSGRSVMLVLVLAVAMMGVSAFPSLRGNIYAYLIVWTGCGSVYVLGGFGNSLIDSVYIIMTLGMWVFGILIGGAISETDQ